MRGDLIDVLWVELHRVERVRDGAHGFVDEPDYSFVLECYYILYV